MKLIDLKNYRRDLINRLLLITRKGFKNGYKNHLEFDYQKVLEELLRVNKEIMRREALKVGTKHK